MRLPWRREQVVSGLGTQENTAKLIALVLVPFYALYFGTYYLIEYNYVDELFGVMLFFVGLAIEISAMYGYNAKQQKEAAEHLSFPASLWRFSPTDKTLIDLFIPPENGVRYIGKISANSIQDICKEIKEVLSGKTEIETLRLEKIELKEKRENSGNNEPVFVYLLQNINAIEYDHPERGPLTFNRFVWICQDNWEEEFQFTPGGETWYGNFPVTHPKSEGVVLHVVDWHDHMGEIIPICVVADSTRNYEATLGRVQLPEPSYASVVGSLLSLMRREVVEVRQQLRNREDQLAAVLSDSHDIRKLLRDWLSDIKRRHGDILREQPPLRYRLINLKTLGVIILVLAIIYLLWTYLGG